MVYISQGGQLVQNDGWSVQKLKRTFWNFIDGVLLFFQTLISPGSNRQGSRYVTQYRTPGSGSGNVQRRIGRPGNVSGVAAPPCGAGGG